MGSFFGLLVLEQVRPLRPSVESKPRRLLRNTTLAAVSALAAGVFQGVSTSACTRWVVRSRKGLLQKLPLPPSLKLVCGILLLDYSLYFWHILTHRVPLLWRLHRIHHADLDLDVSTALRFHFLELAASIPWRLAQIVLFGISPPVLQSWQTFLMLCILFHHSNVRLPSSLDQVLSRVLMTPRLHGIHHCAEERQRDSNFSSGLTVWDFIHGTLCSEVPGPRCRIGVEHLTRPDQVSLLAMLMLRGGARSA